MRAIHETTIRSTWYQRRRISRRRGRQRTSIVKRTFRDALAVTDARGCWTGRDYEDDHFYPGDKNGDGAEPSSTTNLTEVGIIWRNKYFKYYLILSTLFCLKKIVFFIRYTVSKIKYFHFNNRNHKIKYFYFNNLKHKIEYCISCAY
ncbi:uncharacterized protein LOC143220005 [Lasioglossum baleicum]|uniref:uncharacterized protein LOC143220005 n=1 Tax=Lasioglossum baleicum TaxID=434251 RepID=UPI003FCC43F2